MLTMVLHTPLLPEEVLRGYESFAPEYVEIDCPGGKMVVEMLSPAEGRLVRLISPRAEDYLKPEYQPGFILTFKPS